MRGSRRLRFLPASVGGRELELLRPRLVRGIDLDPPNRTLSGATSVRALASFTRADNGGEPCPILWTGSADALLKELSKATNEIYFYELLAAVASLHKPRSVFTG